LCQADDSDSVVVTADVMMSPKRRPNAATETTVTEPMIDLDNTFPVHVNIESAFHLPMVLENRYCDKKVVFLLLQVGLNYMHTVFSGNCLVR